MVIVQLLDVDHFDLSMAISTQATARDTRQLSQIKPNHKAARKNEHIVYDVD
jgi:hypothetical protein